MREIPLRYGNGAVAIIDDADWDEVSKHRWFVFHGQRTNTTYAATVVNRKVMLMHRLLLGMTDRIPVDHRDRNGLNNQRSNIRVADWTLNNANKGVRSDSRSGIKGVSQKRPGRWYASIKCHGKKIHLGVFASPEEAARTYDRKARELFGDFAGLNYPSE